MMSQPLRGSQKSKVKSHGAAKTGLLERTLVALANELKIPAIEGDMTTHLDAEHLRKSGIYVTAINTGCSCHFVVVA